MTLGKMHHGQLIHKELDMYVCILSTVPTDALVLKHQAICIYNAG